jgi:predicted DCC family thiol-disulfide oxidoreductase YuxK
MGVTAPEAPAALIYDGRCGLCVATVRRLVAWARPGSVRLVDFRVPGALAGFPALTPDRCEREIHLVGPDGTTARGPHAFLRVLATRKALRPLVGLSSIPLVGWLADVVYAAVARNRFRLGAGAVPACDDGACAPTRSGGHAGRTRRAPAGPRVGRRLRTAVGVAALLAQLVAVAHSRSGAARYFCWAPNDVTAEFSLQVTVRGERLDPDAMRKRYQRPWFEELDGLGDPRPEACGWTRCGPDPHRPRHPAALDMVEFRSHQHVIDVVRQYERTYGRADEAAVLMRYRINRGPLRSWQWPER